MVRALGRSGLRVSGALLLALGLTPAAGCSSGEDESTPAIQDSIAACQSSTVLEVTTAGMAERVRAAQGHPVLFAIYHVGCGRAASILPVLSDLEGEFVADGLVVYAFGTTGCKKDVEEFLAESGFGLAIPYRLLPWESGELGAALASVDVPIGTTWGSPLVAVIDRNGKRVAMWEEATGYDASAVRAAVKLAAAP